MEVIAAMTSSGEGAEEVACGSPLDDLLREVLVDELHVVRLGD
jgi:hypothetical protein